MGDDLDFTVCMYDGHGNRLERLAMTEHRDAGGIMYLYYCGKYPKDQIVFRQGALVIRKSREDVCREE